MTTPGGLALRKPGKFLLVIAAIAAVAACTLPPAGPDLSMGPFAPGIDPDRPAVDGLEVGHRLMAAGEYELALEAFTRAALQHGMTPEILMGMGSADLGLGRLGQAERMLRKAVEDAPDWPEAWNNLGVVLMERGNVIEARAVFHRAYALDNGESDAIRDNLRLALAKTKNPDNNAPINEDYRLVRRGAGDYRIRKTP